MRMLSGVVLLAGLVAQAQGRTDVLVTVSNVSGADVAVEVTTTSEGASETAKRVLNDRDMRQKVVSRSVLAGRPLTVKIRARHSSTVTGELEVTLTPRRDMPIGFEVQRPVAGVLGIADEGATARAAHDAADRAAAEKDAKKRGEVIAATPIALVATLAEDWDSNEVRAEDRWLLKPIRVVGKASKVFAGNGHPYVGAQTSLGHGLADAVVFCPLDRAEAAKIDPGTPLEFYGTLEPAESIAGRYAWRVGGCELLPDARQDLDAACAKRPAADECRKK